MAAIFGTPPNAFFSLASQPDFVMRIAVSRPKTVSSNESLAENSTIETR
jgi:hypothetical protein